MKKHLLSILITLAAHSYSMEMQQLLPNDIWHDIIKLSIPTIDLLYSQKVAAKSEDQKNLTLIKQNLPLAVKKIIDLKTLCIYINTYITNNSITLLQLTKETINPFLIRSVQANIPYFIKIALSHRANPDFIHKPDGHTPLLYSINANNYAACKFLLENGASPNMKQQAGIWEYGYNPTHVYPIQKAIVQKNLPLVRLLIKHNAALNIHKNPLQPSLLALTAQTNNPYILATLLEAPDFCTSPQWSLEDIDHALVISKNITTRDDKEKLEKKSCIGMLQEAKDFTLKDLHSNPFFEYLRSSNK